MHMHRQPLTQLYYQPAHEARERISEPLQFSKQPYQSLRDPRAYKCKNTIEINSIIDISKEERKPALTSVVQMTGRSVALLCYLALASGFPQGSVIQATEAASRVTGSKIGEPYLNQTIPTGIVFLEGYASLRPQLVQQI